MFAINILIIIRSQLALECVQPTEHIHGPTHERHHNHIQHFSLFERIANSVMTAFFLKKAKEMFNVYAGSPTWS